MAEGIQAGANKKPQLDDQLDRLNNALGETLSLINDLENRVQPVSRSQTPEPTQGSSATVAEDLVPAADAVRQLRYQAESNNRSLQGMLNRLEV